MPFLNQIILLDDEQGEDPSIEVSNSQPSQVIYEKESNIKLDYSELEEGNYYKCFSQTLIHPKKQHLCIQLFSSYFQNI